MPIPVRAFACKWGCRRKTTTHKNDMAAHEDRCYKYPAKMACPTCEHDGEEDGDYFCFEARRTAKERLIYDCPYWVSR
jgi:hypothetical protein